ncbi:MaoC family dehydratase [Tepidiforma sp.]|uniref:MaoC family dehydratase n=1 Tax=Tepidiforma sp. TaxID=2682230 RepID=UPI002ADDFB2A|nr:MaoC family dehydratase [Tepidiforma sp.]
MATYDDISIGDSATFSKTITETDVYLFAGITGDLNPAHVDAVAAGQGMFKQRIAHGILSGSLISTVLAMRLPGPGTIYVSQTFNFRAPVYFGDTLTARVEAIEKLEQRRWVKFRTTVANQDGKTVVEGEAVVIPPSA